ncbi:MULTISPECIES: helix-turn-helix domain-containing protein [Butyricimonas]|uniref:helix-turn-helix domain-containing protein n=1 Tax=Butyricimonas TaxID=574697 RepID=UPI001D07BF4B|nr:MULTISPECIES: helix-turn-helix transcriptional regulator [Butyricimonas]MCB6974783.1 helix-turn-helix domain-containing protein [Butyricimonas synergistica]MCG4521525.1 helix-turn-helix domain-containing protein [Butyricimonas sp. DFI.6.44]
MDTNTITMPKAHQGKNIKRYRDILGIKQETLALELNMTQQAVSKLEQKEEIDDETLNKVAEILKIPVEAIKNLTDEAAVNIIANTFHDEAAALNHFQCTFNPIDKVVELYERMLKAEQEKVKLLQEALQEKK